MVVGNAKMSNDTDVPSIVVEGLRERTAHKQNAQSDTAADRVKSLNTEEAKKEEHEQKTYGRTTNGTGK